MLRFMLLALAPFLASCTADYATVGATGPDLIRIAPDNYHAQWVGEAPDGRLFFATHPFVPGHGPTAAREFIALYLWRKDGSFDEARITELSGDAGDAKNSLERFLVEQLGPAESLTIRTIDVATFSVERDGIAFGLIYRRSEDTEYVEVLPGNYMAFYPPWNGEYDT